MQLTFRKATVDDVDFLWRLHVSTMREMVDATWGWNEAWQHERFLALFAPQRIDIISLQETPAGMMQVDRSASVHVIKNIEILPPYQGLGVGTAILGNIVASATAQSAKVRLQVLRVNLSACRLYERIGFACVGATNTHLQMEWTPPGR